MIGVFVQFNTQSRFSKSAPIGYLVCESGCWEWVGSKRNGYGLVWVEGKHRSAHRHSYEQRHGPIPDGLTLDHLCRKVDCVNPDHLEVVSQRVNVLRGTSPPAEYARRSHCPKCGCEYEKTKRQRLCRTCKRSWDSEYKKNRRRQGKPNRRITR